MQFSFFDDWSFDLPPDRAKLFKEYDMALDEIFRRHPVGRWCDDCSALNSQYMERVRQVGGVHQFRRYRKAQRYWKGQ